MDAMELAFFTTDTPSGEMLEAVDAGLEQYNHRVAPLSQVLPLAAFVTDAGGAVQGGATGRTWGLCCELLELWVADSLRGQGIGSRLLQDFEAHAKTRGCRIFYLTTLSYQAPEFYRRHGYEILARIEGYPDGIVKYLMQKTGTD